MYAPIPAYRGAEVGRCTLMMGSWLVSFAGVIAHTKILKIFNMQKKKKENLKKKN
jgi:hypothetical protein